MCFSQQDFGVSASTPQQSGPMVEAQHHPVGSMTSAERSSADTDDNRVAIGISGREFCIRFYGELISGTKRKLPGSDFHRGLVNQSSRLTAPLIDDAAFQKSATCEAGDPA